MVHWLLVILFVLLPGTAQAAVAFDQAFSGGCALGASPCAYNHTITNALSNAVLLVAITTETTSDIVTGVTYNSVAMTRVATANVGFLACSASCSQYLYYLVAPTADGAAHSVSIAYSGSHEIVADSGSYSGVDQTVVFIRTNNLAATVAASTGVNLSNSVPSSLGVHHIGKSNNEAVTAAVGTKRGEKLGTAVSSTSITSTACDTSGALSANGTWASSVTAAIVALELISSTTEVRIDAISNASGSSPRSATHVTGTTFGNTLMLVGVTVNSTSDVVTGVTYNSIAMSRITNGFKACGATCSSYVYSLIAPAAGSHSATVTFTGGGNANVSVQTYYNVDQTNTLRNTANTNGTGTAASLAVASQTSNAAFGFLSKANNNAGTNPACCQVRGSTTSNSQTAKAFDGAGAASVTIDPSWTGSVGYALVVADICIVGACVPATSATRRLPLLGVGP